MRLRRDYCILNGRYNEDGIESIRKFLKKGLKIPYTQNSMGMGGKQRPGGERRLSVDDYPVALNYRFKDPRIRTP